MPESKSKTVKELERMLDHVRITKRLEEVKIEIAETNLKALNQIEGKFIKELKQVHLLKIREDNLERDMQEAVDRGERIGP